MPRKREIIYPVFLECTQYCEDSFWETVFENLAYGKPPCGAYISKNYLCCSYKNKEFSYKIERKDSETLYTDIYKLLHKKMGVLSRRERDRQKLKFTKMEKSIHEGRQEWSNIKRKHIQDVLYERYVIEMKRKHNLTNKQTKYLLSALHISITFKTIARKDIIFEDENITSINGVEFLKNNGHTEIVFKNSICSKSKRPKKITHKKKTMEKNWEKFIKNQRKIKQ